MIIIFFEILQTACHSHTSLQFLNQIQINYIDYVRLAYLILLNFG